jgi:hypothetical protein
MKAKLHGRNALKLRVRAGLVAILVLISAECWMVTRWGMGYGQISVPTNMEGPALGDCLAIR